MDSSTGHAHDGTTGGGASIPPTGLASLSSNGIATRISTTAFAARTITGTADKITVTDGDGVAGNPTLTIASGYLGQTSITTLGTIATGTWNATTIAVAKGGTGAVNTPNARINLGLEIGVNVQAYSTILAGLVSSNPSDGMIAIADGVWTPVEITGTFNRITVTNGDAFEGNPPTIDISSSYIGQATITTLGTITTGTWNGTTIAIANGGTGQTTANNALNALLPSQSTHNSKFLQTDGTNTAWTTVPAGFGDPGANGIVARTALNTTSARTITGTTNRLTVTNGDGVSGNPTLDISSAYVGQATITTLGTITTGTWNGTTLAIANGGTGTTTASAAFAALKQDATTSATGVVELATTAETLAGTDTTRAITAAGIAGTKSLAANGYYTLPGGLTIQWGVTGTLASTVSTTVTFPVAFSTACYSVTIAPTADNGVNNRAVHLNSTPSTTTVDIRNGTSTSQVVYWMAIGV